MMQSAEPGLIPSFQPGCNFSLPIDSSYFGSYRPSIPKLTSDKDLFIRLNQGETDETIVKVLEAKNLKANIKKLNNQHNKILEFESKDKAELAKQQLEEAKYQVSYAKVLPYDDYNLFIEGLPDNITEQDIRGFIYKSEANPKIKETDIVSIKVLQNRALVRFNTTECAERAIKFLNNTTPEKFAQAISVTKAWRGGAKKVVMNGANMYQQQQQQRNMQASANNRGLYSVQTNGQQQYNHHQQSGRVSNTGRQQQQAAFRANYHNAFIGLNAEQQQQATNLYTQLTGQHLHHLTNGAATNAAASYPAAAFTNGHGQLLNQMFAIGQFPNGYFQANGTAANGQQAQHGQYPQPVANLHHLYQHTPQAHSTVAVTPAEYAGAAVLAQQTAAQQQHMLAAQQSSQAGFFLPYAQQQQTRFYPNHFDMTTQRVASLNLGGAGAQPSATSVAVPSTRHINGQADS